MALKFAEIGEACVEMTDRSLWKSIACQTAMGSLRRTNDRCVDIWSKHKAV